ncbi:hypothetical protein V6N11_057820 [Hibiscus sabdariffa]|uniref:Uncharacterized protein n=1 Tax=Hibiscus sabdariffa TaxID=183260 RepID=A0ABR1ZGB9_9ROSI
MPSVFGSIPLVLGVERLWNVTSFVPRAISLGAGRGDGVVEATKSVSCSARDIVVASADVLLSVGSGASTNEISVACEGSREFSNDPHSHILFIGSCSSTTDGEHSVGPKPQTSSVAPTSGVGHGVPEDEGREIPEILLLVSKPQTGKFSIQHFSGSTYRSSHSPSDC